VTFQGHFSVLRGAIFHSLQALFSDVVQARHSKNYSNFHIHVGLVCLNRQQLTCSVGAVFRQLLQVKWLSHSPGKFKGVRR